MCERCEAQGSELTAKEAERCRKLANWMNEMFCEGELTVLEVEMTLGVMLGDHFRAAPERLQPWVNRLLDYFEEGRSHAEEAGEAAQARGVH